MMRPAPPAALRPISTFGLMSLGLLLAVWAASAVAYTGVVVVIPVVAFAVISLVAMTGLARHFAYPHLGACNAVTLARAAIVAVLAGAILTPPVTTAAAWALCGAATVAFAMDGLDGWLARRSGMSSGFGARFDMETDALLAAVLALILWRMGDVGPAVLILGFARYVFVVLTVAWPALARPLPESMRRKSVCVVQIAALIVLLLPLTPTVLLAPVAIGAGCLLLWSFAVDILRLTRA